MGRRRKGKPLLARSANAGMVPVMRRRKTRQLPSATHSWSVLKNPFEPQNIFSQDRVEAIHQAALDVLQNLGIKVLLPEAIELLTKHGAAASGQMLRIGSDMVEAALASAPKSFTLYAPNRARNLPVAPGQLIFAPGGGCPNVSDAIRGRRAGDLASYQDAVRLMQSFDVIHKLSPAPEPQDIPVHLRHYAMMQTQMGLGDKALTVYGRGRQQVQECFDIIQAALDLSDAEFTAAPYCSTVINTNSPRMLDRPMAQALIDFARAGQMCIVTPFCLAGAMAPITIAGALTLQHAEALAAITLNQLAKPGAPVMYGGFGSNVDMKSGAPSFGTPEHIQMSIGSGQMARHIGLPWRSAAGAAANTNDMQATHETVMSLWGCLQANATMVIHAAGWLEGGLTFGFEKFIQDIEALQAIAHLCKPVAADTAAIGLDAIGQVAPGGHFFETDQTLKHYSTAFLEPVNADLTNFGTWQKNGALTAEARATAKWQAILHDFTAPPGAEERMGRMEAMIAKFTQAGGAPIVE
jgi:trimethylamine--corrinoid protein Co-methyltransferase